MLLPPHNLVHILETDFIIKINFLIFVYRFDCHVVFLLQGNRTNFSRIREPQQVTPDLQETDEDVHSSEVDSSASTKFYPNDYQVNSQVTDTTSLSSAQASEYEDAESGIFLINFFWVRF